MAEGFQHFLNSAGKYPLLSHEQELMLGRDVQAWIAIRDLDVMTPEQKRTARIGRRAYDKFFKSNLRLVVSVAKKYARMCQFLTTDDLVQEGCLGLSRAIEKFDPARGYKFSTYAYWWIRQGITRAQTQQDSHIRLPGPCVDALRKVRQMIPRFVADHKRFPTVEEMAEHVNITRDSMRAYLPHILGIQSLNVKVNNSEDNGSQLIDLIASSVESPLDKAATSDAWEVVQAMLPKLTPKQRFALSCHWGLEGSPQMNLREIGDELGVSRESARGHEMKAMRRIRVLAASRVRESLVA